MKNSIVFLEGTRDSIFLRYLVELSFKSKGMSYEISEGYVKISGIRVSGSFTITTNNHRIFLIPVNGIDSLKMIIENIKLDLIQRNLIEIPMLEFENTILIRLTPDDWIKSCSFLITIGDMK